MRDSPRSSMYETKATTDNRFIVLLRFFNLRYKYIWADAASPQDRSQTLIHPLILWLLFKRFLYDAVRVAVVTVAGCFFLITLWVWNRFLNAVGLVLNGHILNLTLQRKQQQMPPPSQFYLSLFSTSSFSTSTCNPHAAALRTCSPGVLLVQHPGEAGSTLSCFSPCFGVSLCCSSACHSCFGSLFLLAVCGKYKRIAVVDLVSLLRRTQPHRPIY